MVLRNVRSVFATVATIAAAGFILASSGCDSTPHNSGPDMVFLTASLNTSDSPVIRSTNLLPIKKGNSWQMITSTRGKRFNDSVVDVGPSTVPGVEGTEFALLREGQPWRREFYHEDKSGITLPAIQDETSPVMVLDPPIPLVKYPIHEGGSVTWHGILTIKNMQLPASAFSRVSALEIVRTPAGEFKTARIDTMIILNDNGRDIRFPSVRWLSPDIGFVRRGFADKGQPAFSETTKLNVH